MESFCFPQARTVQHSVSRRTKRLGIGSDINSSDSEKTIPAPSIYLKKIIPPTVTSNSDEVNDDLQAQDNNLEFDSLTSEISHSTILIICGKC